MKLVCALFLSFVLLPITAQAAVVFSDDFSHADGSLVTNSSFVWSTHSGTDGDMQVNSGRVQLSQILSEDVHAMLANAPYSSGNLYAGFTVNFSALPSGSSSSNYFLHFGSSTFRAKVFATTIGAATGTFRLGIENNSNPLVTIPADLALNTDYFIVLRYNTGTPASTLWLEPDSESSTNHRADASDSTTASAISAISLRQSNSGGGMGILKIDNLRVGTTFGDAVTSQPGTPPGIVIQPASQVVSEGEDVTFSVGATGSLPLSYQWKYNSEDMAGETNATLVLLNVTTNDAGNYRVTISNAFGWTNSQVATLAVNPGSSGATFSLVTYNVKGNSATNWSTNSLQVQAIARQLQFLQPDVITFNEIPFDLRYEMTNFVAVFLPGYSLAISSGTDGSICSAIASRHTITRASKWLDGVDLRNFGYTNTNNNLDNFTRDLYEAQISVPGFSRPVHVFTTHLKATTSSAEYADNAAKRAAEAAAITNFFATNLFVLHPFDPYILSGDMNANDTNELAIQRLISPATGLKLTQPKNPVTGSINTYSTTAANPSSRLDYIFPGALLYSNIRTSQVFRTDRLTPLPPNLNSNDCKVASDHFPVLMVFNNPYDNAFRLTSLTRMAPGVTLTWESVFGQRYRVDASSNLTTWNVVASNLIATSNTFSFTTNSAQSNRYFRVYRVP